MPKRRTHNRRQRRGTRRNKRNTKYARRVKRMRGGDLQVRSIVEPIQNKSPISFDALKKLVEVNAQTKKYDKIKIAILKEIDDTHSTAFGKFNIVNITELQYITVDAEDNIIFTVPNNNGSIVVSKSNYPIIYFIDYLKEWDPTDWGLKLAAHSSGSNYNPDNKGHVLPFGARRGAELFGRYK